MKILFMSDAHQEHYHNQRDAEDTGFWGIKDLDFDIAIFGGDDAVGINNVHFAKRMIGNEKPIILLNGNHTFYGNHYPTMLEYTRAQTKDNVHVLAPGTVSFGNLHIIGATLWSRAQLKQYDPVFSELAAQKNISDFRVIKYGQNDERFNVQIMQSINKKETEYIEEQLDNLTGTKIVVTHFPMSAESIQEKYRHDELSAYFTNDLDHLVAKCDLHLFGHDHSRQDFTHSSGTRMISNCYGYPSELPGFKLKIIELE